MRVDTRPRKRNAPRPAEKSAPRFLRWLRGRECAFHQYGDCDGKIEAMHLDFAGGKGVGSKVADKYCLPSCGGHHRRQHAEGWTTFCKRLGVSKEVLLDGAAQFWRAWPDRHKWETING